MKYVGHAVNVLFCLGWLIFGASLALSVIFPIGRMQPEDIPFQYAMQCAVIVFVGAITILKYKLFHEKS